MYVTKRMTGRTVEEGGGGGGGEGGGGKRKRSQLVDRILFWEKIKTLNLHKNNDYDPEILAQHNPKIKRL